MELVKLSCQMPCMFWFDKKKLCDLEKKIDNLMKTFKDNQIYK